jgi:hypothetical protein
MNDESKRELLMTRIKDGFVAERVDVTGWPEDRIQMHMGRILSKPDFDVKNWIIRDTGWKPN